MLWIILIFGGVAVALTAAVCWLAASALDYQDYVKQLEQSKSRLRAENIELRSQLARRDGPFMPQARQPRHARIADSEVLRSGVPYPRFPTKEEREIEKAVDDILAPDLVPG